MCSRLVLSSSEKTESEITYHEWKNLWTVHDDLIPCHLILKRVLPEIAGPEANQMVFGNISRGADERKYHTYTVFDRTLLQS